MSVVVKIPTQLRPATAGHATVEIEGAATVGEVFSRLGQAHPDLVERIMDEGGELRRFINVYVGDEDVRFLEGMQTPVQGTEIISILPAVAGGSGVRP